MGRPGLKKRRPSKKLESSLATARTLRDIRQLWRQQEKRCRSARSPMDAPIPLQKHAW